MKELLIVIVVLPLILFATEWLSSDYFDEFSDSYAKSSAKKGEGKFVNVYSLLRNIDLRKSALTFVIVSLFLITLRSLLSGKYQVLVGEVVLISIAAISILGLSSYAKFRKRTILIERYESELPELISMLTLLMSAGESVTSAITYLSQFTNSSCGKVFHEVITMQKSGASITQALDKAVEKTHSRSFRKLTDSIALSIDRGSPLTVTLLNQTAESRSQYKAHLLRRAGKAELKLMVPVVFLILPLSIVFALLPSLQSLSTVI